MDFNISFAGWVLSMLSFLTGTIVPVIYRKLSFDGFVVKSIVDNTLSITFEEKNDVKSNYVFLVLKYVNAKQQPVLIEEINPFFKNVDGNQLNVLKSFSEKVETGEPLAILSRHNSPDSVNYSADELSINLDQLPFLIEGNSEVVWAHLFKVGFLGSDEKSSLNNVVKNIKKGTVKVEMKVNGKLRSYNFKIK